MTTTTTTTTTYRNDKTGATVTTALSREEIAARFAATAGGENWMWYWLAKYVSEREVQPARAGLIGFLADSFLYAIGVGATVRREKGVKQRNPMIRFQVANRRYKIYLSKRGTLCFKAGAVKPGTSNPVGDEEYIGCLFEGRFLVNKDRALLAEEQAALDGLTADPVGFLARASKDMDRCCYCNAPLSDKRSKDAGYGETCAQTWGLPWGKDYDEKVPSFAQLWQAADSGERRNVRMMCQAVRRSPRDETAWAVLADAMETVGLRRVAMPAPGVTIPQADKGGDGLAPAMPGARPAAQPAPAMPPAPPAPAPKAEVKTVSRARVKYNPAVRFVGAEKRFTVEASSVGLTGYPSIIDFEGKTGRVIPFVRREVFRNNDNETTHAEYTAAEGGFSLVVLND